MSEGFLLAKPLTSRRDMSSNLEWSVYLWSFIFIFQGAGKVVQGFERGIMVCRFHKNLDIFHSLTIN